MKMSKEAKEKLKLVPIKRCSICNTPRSYMNPVWKCESCLKLFCFSHLIAGQINDKMKENDETRNVCKSCKEKYSYYSL